MSSVFDEVGDRVFRRRYESLDLNVGVVLGDAGALVIDSRASHRQADVLLDELRALTPLPVAWLVNTHWHWDHTFGNARFGGAEIWGHVACRDHLVAEGEHDKLRLMEMFDEGERDEIAEVEIVPPDHVFASSASIDVGGRAVVVEFLGLGHTASDVVVGVSDDPVVFAGDLLEEGAPPSFGDSYPLSWMTTLGLLIERVGGVVVPGHGDVMDAGAAAAQRAEIGAIVELAMAASIEDRPLAAIDVAAGPYPEHVMRTALERALREIAG